MIPAGPGPVLPSAPVETADPPIRIPRYQLGSTLRAAAGVATVSARSAVRARRRHRRADTDRHVRTPTLLQLHEVDCAAAVLGIVLATHGRWVPLRQLREDCGISRDGGKATHLLTAAASHGLEAKALRRSIQGLRDVPLPSIVFWQANHFLVVEGFGEGVVLVNDPASGHRVLTDDEFLRGYTGICFTMVPGPGFERAGAPPSRRRAGLERIGGARALVLLAAALAFAAAVPAILGPVLIRAFVDEALFGDAAAGTRIAWAMVGLGVVAVVLAWWQAEVLRRAWLRVAGREGRRVMRHLLQLPMRFVLVRFSGDLASRVQLTDQLAQLLGPDLVNGLINLLLIGVFVLAAAAYDPLLAVLGAIVGVVDLLALRLVLGAQQDDALRLGREQSRLMATSVHGIAALESVKAMGAEDELHARWAGQHARLVNAQAQAARPLRALLAVPPLLATLTTVLVLTVGGLQVVGGTLSIGALVAVQALLAAAAAPRATVIGLAGSIHRFDGLVAQLDDILEQPDEVGSASPDAEATSAETVRGGIELRGITFGYGPLDPPLIDRLDLHVAAGSRVALVGATGSGKTTLVRLVTGLATPWSGEILLDGRPRSAWSRSDLTRAVAAVDQEIQLFSATVRDNLTLWDRTVPDERLESAAADACILDIIQGRAGGFDARVSEAGRNLSGGERQRLMLARALVGDPALLVLDEATSHLDPPTEAEVLDNLRRRGCTCLIVAHRVSAIRDCDEIVVLERGAIVERGDHDALIARGGCYARLLEAEGAG